MHGWRRRAGHLTVSTRWNDFATLGRAAWVRWSLCRLWGRNRIIARNQDDHVKNIAFLMDKTGQWSLAPAFDVTYSYNPSGDWTATHQMTMNGKRDGFTLADFRACARSALMKRGRAEAIVEEMRAAVAKWPDYAEQAKVINEWRDQIQRNHRLDLAQI